MFPHWKGKKASVTIQPFLSGSLKGHFSCPTGAAEDSRLFTCCSCRCCFYKIKCLSNGNVSKKEMERVCTAPSKNDIILRGIKKKKHPRRIWNHLLSMQGRILLGWKYQLAAFPGKMPLLERKSQLLPQGTSLLRQKKRDFRQCVEVSLWLEKEKRKLPVCQGNTQETQRAVGTFLTRGWQRGDKSSARGCSSSTPQKSNKDQPNVLSISDRGYKTPPGDQRGLPSLCCLWESWGVFVLTSPPGRWQFPWWGHLEPQRSLYGLKDFPGKWDCCH